MSQSSLKENNLSNNSEIVLGKFFSSASKMISVGEFYKEGESFIIS